MADGGSFWLNEDEMNCEFSASQQFQPVNDNRSRSAWDVQISEATNERLRQTPSTETEKRMQFCGVSASEQYYFQEVGGSQSVIDDGNKASKVHQILENANERLRQTSADKKEDIELRETLLKLPPLSLTFPEVTGSLLESIENKSFHANNSSSRCDAGPSHNFSVQGWVQATASNDAEKLKASNFCASFLRIGSWEEVSKREGALVAKCYYAKRRLVWEIMKDGLKSKIEIQWSDILAIRASIGEGQPGILEIELNTPPKFYQETDPMPRKHTHWEITSDFTDGQALIHRRHYIEFPAGNLDKHLDKLLQSDSRMLMMSTRPFPSLTFPYFHSDFNNETREFSLDFNLDGLNINSGNQSPHFSSTPTPLPLVQQVQAYEQTNQPYFPVNDSEGMIVDFAPQLDENVSNLEEENSRMAIWRQEMIDSNDLLGRDPIPEPFSIAKNKVRDQFQAFSIAVKNQVRDQIQYPFCIAIQNQARDQIQGPISVAIEKMRDQIQDPFAVGIENQVRDQIQYPYFIIAENQVRDQIRDPFLISIGNPFSTPVPEPFAIPMPAQVNPAIPYQNYNIPAPYAEEEVVLSSDIDMLNNVINKFNTGDLELQCIDQKGYITRRRNDTIDDFEDVS